MGCACYFLRPQGHSLVFLEEFVARGWCTSPVAYFQRGQEMQERAESQYIVAAYSQQVRA